MDIWTIQISQWRLAEAASIPLLDTTVKSGDKAFAPSWGIVLDVKRAIITPETYTREYHRLMRRSYRENKARWLEVCHMPQVAIACYCKAHCFCHRYLLLDMLIAVCIGQGLVYEDRGELGSPRNGR